MQHTPPWPHRAITTLTAHPNGQWCKKIAGKVRYFGPVADPDGALRRYLALAQATLDNRPVVVQSSDVTVELAVNRYLTARKRDLQAKKLTPGMFACYHWAGQFLVEHLGRARRVCDLGPSEFEHLRGLLPGGPAMVANRVRWIRSIFKATGEFYGVVPRYGGMFKLPSMGEMRAVRRSRAFWSPAEIQRVMKHCRPPTLCHLLLGLNGGFGASDLAQLPAADVDLRRGVIDTRRPKTHIRRVVPLWPETVKALRAYHRPNDALPELFFVTKHRHPWVQTVPVLDAAGTVKRVQWSDSVARELSKAAKAARVPHLAFYTLRHQFRSLAEGQGSPNAIRAIMGHAFPGMDEFYLHLDVSALRQVTEAVRRSVLGASARHGSDRPSRRRPGGRG